MTEPKIPAHHAPCPNPKCDGVPVVDGEPSKEPGHHVAWIECSKCDWQTPRKRWSTKQDADAKAWEFWDRGRVETDQPVDEMAIFMAGFHASQNGGQPFEAWERFDALQDYQARQAHPVVKDSLTSATDGDAQAGE